VDKVVSLAELNGAAQKIAKNFADKPIRSLAGIKRLLNYSMKELEDYLELESQVLLKMLVRYW
jgi:enoyl-CoA hydratase/carnithine racemase